MARLGVEGRFRFDSVRFDSSGDTPLADGLTEILGPGELVAYFQPVVEMGGHRLRGVEALARWVAPGGQVSEPKDFVPRLEAYGVGPNLDAQMLALAATQVASWRAQPGFEALEVHVNISAEGLRDAGLATLVRQICDHSGLPPAALWLEVTEGSMINDLAAARVNLAEVRAMGARVAVDDFGTGYATLVYVKALPIDGIKIDRGFVTDITADVADRAIVGAVVRMALQLSLTVVAEGVEGPAQESGLAELGVRFAQGYYYGPPLPAAEALSSFLAGEDPTPAPFVARPHTADEEDRLRVLDICGLVEHDQDGEFDTLTRLAARLCETPEAAFSGVGRDRTWAVSLFGAGLQSVAREQSLVIQVLTEPGRLLVVSDTLDDGRFAAHPAVRGEGGVRFFAGVPLVVAGHVIAMLSVSDRRPRHLEADQLEVLEVLAADAQTLLELRYRTAQLNDAQALLTQVSDPAHRT